MKKITKELIKNFRRYLIEEEKAAATVEKYIRDINVFADWLGEKDLDKETVLTYKENLIKNYAPASVNSVLSSLNSFFTFNEWYNLRVKNLKIQRQTFANKDNELSKEEYERLLTAAKSKGNEQLYFLMQTICATGIRVSELRYVTVESLKAQKAQINLKGKMRVVLLPKELCKMLLKYSKEQKITSGSVFVSRNGKPRTCFEEQAGHYVHLALNVKDSKAAFDRAIAYGAKEKMEPKSMELPSEPPFPVVISFVYGPDGEELEFFQVR